MSEQSAPVQRPYDADTCRTHVLEAAQRFPTLKEKPEITQGMRGAIIGTINYIFGSDGKGEQDSKRHTVLGWLFGDPDKPIKPKSTKELTEGQWYALYRWLDLKPLLTPDGRNKWLPCQDFNTEALFVLNAAIRKMYKDEGQMMMQLGLEESDE